jgi:hypothetical protein
MAKEGTGRNAIARLLNGQGLRISEGSVGNIIREYRRQESARPEAQRPHPTQQEQPQVNNTYTKDNVIDTGSPSSTTTTPLGDGLKPTESTKSDSLRKKNSGNPLSFFNTTTLSADDTTIVVPTVSDDATVATKPELTLHPLINNNPNPIPTTKVTTPVLAAIVEEEDVTTPSPNTPSFTNTLPESTFDRPELEEEEQPSVTSMEMDWDSEDLVRRRFWARDHSLRYLTADNSYINSKFR